MKIFHVLDHSIPIQSGYSFRTRSILLEQRARGWETCQLTGYRQDEALEKGCEFDSLYFYRTDKAPWQSVPVLRYVGMVLAMKRELESALKIEKPDILHAHSPSLNGLAALWAARGTKIPVVYEVRAFWEDAAVDHGTTQEKDVKYKLIRWLEGFVLNRVSAVTTICEGLRKDMVDRGIPASKIQVIQNAVDLKKFDVLESKNMNLLQEYNLEDSIVLGFVGSFYAYEGLDVLIKAMPKVLKEYPSAKLILIGGEEQEDELKALTKSLQLSDTVIFAGRVPHAQVREYYSVIDILVYPRKSIRLTELVTPLKPLEAFALGKVIAVSDVGGHKEITGDLFPYICFEADNVDSLVSRLNDLLGRLKDLDYMKKSGREYVERERSWPVVVARYGPIYRQLIRLRSNV